MLASIFISGISLVLLVYWFRYTCLLLLRARQEPSLIARVAEANGLNLLGVQGQLQSSDSDSWHAVERALDHDYEILVFLLEHAAELGGSRLERSMLALDFRIMQVWYRLTRATAPGNARAALSEMAAVLTRMSAMVGEKPETPA